MKQPGILLSIFVTAALLATGQRAWGQEQMTWSGLQAALESCSTDAEHPTLITLNNDVVASGEDSYLELPAYKHVILDLNGHAIDRRLTEAKDNGGFVLKRNDGCALTIRDSGGYHRIL
ncbi:MAG: hypothetical protein K6G79_00095 [Bacteroidales bacterium]|nr:hypothetical protein [Bacteroidales bacterium]